MKFRVGSEYQNSEDIAKDINSLFLA
jgi:hypothetical protein